jgi:hypothetical protein
MQINTRRFFEERNGIKANSMLEMLRITRISFLFVIILYLVIFVGSFLLFVEGRHSIMSLLPLWAFIVVMAAIGFAASRAQGRYWKRIEQQRLGIVQGGCTLLAAEQPVLNVASMRLPLTIKMRYSKKFLLLITGLGLLMALFFAEVLSLSGIWFFISNALLFFLIIVLFLVVIVAVILGLGRQWIKVTEGGITVRYGRETNMVMWEEARLLAMYDTYGAQKSGAAITYELSSATDIVRWTWVRRKTYFVNQEPTVPLDEHSRQMQELLALVEAKTGLALHYLRH